MHIYSRGQSVFHTYSLAVLASNLCNLVIGLSLPNLRYPLATTGRSDSAGKARVRYMATAARLDTSLDLCDCPEVDPPPFLTYTVFLGSSKSN